MLRWHKSCICFCLYVSIKSSKQTKSPETETAWWGDALAWFSVECLETYFQVLVPIHGNLRCEWSLGTTDIPNSYLGDPQQPNCHVLVPVSGLITSQMLFQGSWAKLKHEPGWHPLSSYQTFVWFTLSEQKQDLQDRRLVQRDYWRCLLWATLCHLVTDKWVQKGSGNGSDLAVNTGNIYLKPVGGRGS